MTINLCFHGVGVCTVEREPGEARYWMGTDVFRGVLDAVRGRDDVALSFDDGNRSDVDIALPALVERGLTATFFVLAGRLDDAASVGPDDLRVLRAQGMSIGNHGWHHIPWQHLTAAAAERELGDARVVLRQQSAGPVDEVAAPLGRYDRATLSRARKEGYRAFHTSDRFPARPGSWLRARFSVTADDTVESVTRILTHRPRAEEAVNEAKSFVKRLR